MSVGAEWIVDAEGCAPEALADAALVTALMARVIRELELRVVGDPQVHTFGGPGGVTALYLLTESHLACHTYPERGVATVNLFCCRPRPEWPWAERLRGALGATHVTVRKVPRGPESPKGA